VRASTATRRPSTAERNPQSFRRDASQSAQRSVVRPTLWYARGVGGTTLHYTANYCRIREIDFNERSVLGEISGTGFADWPLSYADLEPNYTKVDWEIGVSGVLFERGARKLGLHPIRAPLAINSTVYNGRPACVNCGFCHGFACEVMAKASTLTTVIPQGAGDGQLRSTRGKLRLTTRNRQAWTRHGRRVFRCQRSRALPEGARRGGGGKRRRVAAAATEFFDRAFPQWTRELEWPRRQILMFNYTSRAVGVFEHALNEYKSVQVTRILHDFYDSDPKRGFYGGGGLDARIGPQSTMWALRTATEGPGWGKGLKDRLREFPRSMQVSAHSTSLPLESNSVSIDPTLKDAWGVPATRATYRDHPDDLSTSRWLQDRGAEILDAAGALRVSKGPVTESGRAFHLLGTCRMGNDATKSVVDRFHRSHDVPSLFVCDGSSLVTSGRGQPTMTIQALAFRAGEHIARFAQRNEI
jgi:choline dehydrogenase-like flavoprotein